MNSIEQLNWRYAVKNFDPSKKLSEAQLNLVKESLRLAPSSFGLQSWKFIFVENTELRSKIRAKAWNQAQVEEASHLIVLCRPERIGVDDVEKFIKFTHSERGTPMDALQGYRKMLIGFVEGLSDDRAKTWMDRQVYIALGQMMTICALEGIDTCPLEGFDPPGVDEILDLRSKKLQSVVLCSIGFRLASDKYADLKKLRYPMNEIVETI